VLIDRGDLAEIQFYDNATDKILEAVFDAKSYEVARGLVGDLVPTDLTGDARRDLVEARRTAKGMALCASAIQRPISPKAAKLAAMLWIKDVKKVHSQRQTTARLFRALSKAPQ